MPGTCKYLWLELSHGRQVHCPSPMAGKRGDHGLLASRVRALPGMLISTSDKTCARLDRMETFKKHSSPKKTLIHMQL